MKVTQTVCHVDTWIPSYNAKSQCDSNTTCQAKILKPTTEPVGVAATPLVDILEILGSNAGYPH
jgi:hypothetical protein